MLFRIVLIHLIAVNCTYGQGSLNSEEFLPLFHTKYSQLYQKIRIIENEDTAYIYQKYQLSYIDGKTFFISETFDEQERLTLQVIELVTKRGLKFNRAVSVEYLESGEKYYWEVKSRKKITYPFKPINKLNTKKIKTKSIYNEKIIVRSVISFSYDPEREEFVYIRDVNRKFKKNYPKESFAQNFEATYKFGMGIISYVSTGDFNYVAEVVWSNYY